MSKVAIVYIHGQGTYKENSYKEMMENVLGEVEYNKSQVEIFPVMYYSKIQGNQDKLLSRMNSVPWMLSRIREKLVSSFGDPSTIYFNKKEYDYVMSKVKDQFINAQKYVGNKGHIVLIGHSLGSIIASNYLWDANKAGIKYTNLKLMITTGSPLFVFISGKDVDDIKPIRKQSFRFKWINFYNSRDPLSSEYENFSPEYKDLVEDVKIKGGLYFFAHGKYKSSKKCYKRIAKEIQYLLEE